MALKGLCHFLEWFEAGTIDPLTPSIQEFPCPGRARVRPKLFELVDVQPCPDRFQVVPKDGVHARTVFPRPVGREAKQAPPGIFKQRAFAGLVKGDLFPPPDSVQGIGLKALEMESVQDMQSQGEPFAHDGECCPPEI